MTIREYAEQAKAAAGAILAVYEATKDVKDPMTPIAATTTIIKALPQGALNSLASFFPKPEDIAAFCIAVGPLLGQIAPAA